MQEEREDASLWDTERDLLILFFLMHISLSVKRTPELLGLTSKTMPEGDLTRLLAKNN